MIQYTFVPLFCHHFQFMKRKLPIHAHELTGKNSIPRAEIAFLKVNGS